MILFIALVSSIHYYLWCRLVRDMHLPRPLHYLFTAILLFLDACMPAVLIMRRLQVDAPLFTWFVWIWAGVMFLTFVGLLVTEVLHAAGLRLMGQRINMDRRLLLSRVMGGAAAAFGAGAGATAVHEALAGPDVTRVSVPLARLPAALHGYTLAQISDLHIAETLGADYVQSVVERVNACKPQAIVITGDLCDGPIHKLADVARLLQKLEAPHGIFFVTGNHEYYNGVDAWLELLPQLGIKPLRNERVSLGNGDATFDLAGIDDLSAAEHGKGHGPDLQRALAGRDPRRELVLLAHQPKAIAMASAAGVGLMLSGHTHAGQLWPLGYFVRLQQPYVQGLALHESTYIYVNRGTGYVGPPMRLDAPPEITLIELQAPT